MPDPAVFTEFHHAPVDGVAVSRAARRCLVCERRAMNTEVPEDIDIARVLSPSKLVHLSDGSGFTFCGKDSLGWVQEATS